MTELWAVVNNAGVACSSEIEWCPMEVYKQMLDVNALGVVEVTKSFLPFLKQSQGRIVIVTSLSGESISPFFIRNVSIDTHSHPNRQDELPCLDSRRIPCRNMLLFLSPMVYAEKWRNGTSVSTPSSLLFTGHLEHVIIKLTELADLVITC